MSAAQWNRVARLLDRKIEVEVEIDVKATFHEDDTNGYNVVAELPGTDKKGEVVMLGAHLDSWHPGTGATDNAAGSAVMMEAMRILKAIDAKPRRTVRIGLWGGEEQGLLGSRAYVNEHFASRPEPKEAGPDELPSFMRNEPPAPMTLKPDHAKLSAYFNLDNGTGKIRGVYLQGNAAVKPIFEAWMEPVKDLGATRITMRNTGGTDHQSFDAVGLPGFQFIQDPIEYMDGTFFGTHHTNMDIYDRLQREDLMQAAVVIATFAYNAAMRDEMLPRKPLPPVAAPPRRAGSGGQGGRRAARSRRRRPSRPPRGPGRVERGTGARRLNLFAYGTLMTVEGLREALGARADALTFRPARLPGWRRIWNVFRPEWGGGVLNLEPSPADVVVGMLIEGLGELDFQVLDAQEATHLPRETVYVEPLAGEVVPAQVYRRKKGNHAGKPSGRYKTVVLERAYRSGWEVYESLCRGTVDAAGNPLTFGCLRRYPEPWSASPRSRCCCCPRTRTPWARSSAG